MRKIINYDILSSPSKTILIERVKEKLKEGWVIYGHPYIMNIEQYQAMVKYEDEKIILKD